MRRDHLGVIPEFPKKGSQKSTQKIIDLICENRSITIEKLALEVGISDRAVKKQLVTFTRQHCKNTRQICNAVDNSLGTTIQLETFIGLFLLAGVDGGDAEGQRVDVDVAETGVGDHLGKFLVGGKLQHRVRQVLVGVVS